MARLPAIAVAGLVVLALTAAQRPSWDFRWDPRACCCEKAGPCPCPEHELPHEEESPSVRGCGSGGSYLTNVSPPVLGLPPAPLAIVARAEPAPAAPRLPLPHLPPDVDRPRGPS